MSGASEPFINIPGMSCEQVVAEFGAGSKADDEPSYSVKLTKGQCQEFEKAAGEAEYLLLNASAVLEYLHASECAGDFDKHGRGKAAILELVARGLDAAASDEGVKLTQLSGILRSEKELINATDE